MLLKPALNNNKKNQNLCHENISITQKSILSLMKAKAKLLITLLLRPCMHIYTLCLQYMIQFRPEGGSVCPTNCCFLPDVSGGLVTGITSLDKHSFVMCVILSREPFLVTHQSACTSPCTICSLKWIFNIFNLVEMKKTSHLLNMPLFYRFPCDFLKIP